MNLGLLRSTISSFRSDPRLVKAAVDIGQLVARNVASLAISLVVASVVTSALSREQYGMYQFTAAVVASLSFLSLSGLNQAIMQETAKGHHGALSRTLPLRLKAAALYAAVLLCVAAYYQFVARQPALALCLAAVSLLSPLASAFDVYRSYLLGRRDYALYARLPVLISLALAPVTALTAWWTRSPAAILFVGGVVQVALQCAAYRVALGRQPPQNNECASSALRFGFGLSALNIMPTISAQLGPVLVGTLLSMPDVAVLTLAFMPIDKSKILLSALGEFFGPHVVSQSGPALFRRANRVILIYSIVILSFALVLAGMTPLVFKIFFPKYLDVVPLAILSAFCLLPSAPATVMEMTLYSQERLRQTGAMRFAQFAFDLGLAFVLIQTWGITGMIVSRFLAGSLRTLMTLAFYVKNRREAVRAAAGIPLINE